MSPASLNEDIRDGIQEVANVAVGQAADRIARSFSTFVHLPIPRVNLIEASDIRMALSAVDSSQQVTAAIQPFVGSGISGEALLILTDVSLDDLASLMGYSSPDVTSTNKEGELVLEIASLLNGSCVQGICNQLELGVLLKHPKLLAQHRSLTDVLREENLPWQQALAIELNYGFEGYEICCDLLILFHEWSLETLFSKVALLMD